MLSDEFLLPVCQYLLARKICNVIVVFAGANISDKNKETNEAGKRHTKHWDKGQGTKDKGQGTRDKGQGTRDKGQ